MSRTSAPFPPVPAAHRTVRTAAVLLLSALACAGLASGAAAAAEPGAGGPEWQQSSFHLGKDALTISRTHSGFTKDGTAFFLQETYGFTPAGIDHVVTSSHS